MSIISLTACQNEPAIPISDLLKRALDANYEEYVSQMNAAAKGDNQSLHNFLLHDDIEDAAVYDHGWVVIQLMKKVGDQKFTSALKTLSQQEVETVKKYIGAGLDCGHNRQLIREFPLTFSYLKYTHVKLRVYE